MEHPVQIMGILNLTPDSFSDGGLWLDEAAMDARIDQLLDEGADIIDVGGESSRPFAEGVKAEEELKRVIPAIHKIRQRSAIPISVDTTKAAVALAALEAGATMINDISALRHDPDMINVVCAFDGPVVLMHMQGTPSDMQLAPHYEDVIAEINEFFTQRIRWMEARGVSRQRIIVDPGIGFGKTVAHNLVILKNICSLKQHGCPVLIGHSRKSFLGRLLGLPVERRDCITAQLSVFCAEHGADILRIHAVGETKLALAMHRYLTENTEFLI
ncbi:MAG: dihydropteroate synthase [Desulfobulbus sp.]|nr:dihydropteroate synthase [Desulfobulbus sp.]